MEVIGYMQAISGYEDTFNTKALGENFSDIDDIEDIAIGMRGLYAGSSEQVINASASDSSPSTEADTSADTIEWDPTDLLGHA